MDIDPLRTFCMKLPAVTEDIKWGHDLVSSVGSKMFCVAGVLKNVPKVIALSFQHFLFAHLHIRTYAHSCIFIDNPSS